MAPKKKGGKKGGKKKKAPAFYVTEEDTAPFGMKVNDIIRTPLGLTGTVIGVKYEDPEQKQTGRLWVKYETGQEAPLEPRAAAGFLGALGYRRCAESDHIRRDLDDYKAAVKESEDKRRALEEEARLKALGLWVEPEKKGKKKGGKKKK